MMAERELLLDVLNNLSPEEYSTFLYFLRDKRLDPPLTRKETENVSVIELVQTLDEVYTDRSTSIASEIVKKIKRNDLWEKLNAIPSDFRMEDICAPSIQETQRGNWPVVQDQLKGNWTGVQETQRGTWLQQMTTVSPHRRKELHTTLVTDKQLMQLAKKIGKSWKQIAIEFLGIENNKLDQIEGDNQNNQVMKTFHMFKAWKNKERKKATAERLYQLLSQDEVPIDPEAYEFLIEYSE